MTNTDDNGRVRLEVTRQPLFAAEKSVEMRFSADGKLFTHDVKCGLSWKVEATRCLIRCINKPSVVFGNLKRQNFTDGFCYVTPIVGKRTGFVLTAFAVINNGEMFFTDWRHRLEDPRASGFPLNFRSDLGDVLWQK